MAPTFVRASAFLMPPGDGDIIAGTAFSGSVRAFDQNGKLIPIPSYEKFGLGSYIEYGLTDRLTLIAQPFADAIRQDPSSPVAIGGADIGARFGIANFGPTVVSIQADAHLPAGANRLPEGGFDEDQAVAGDLRLLLGHTFQLAGAWSFVDLEGGYRWQGDGAPDEWHADLSLGVRPQPRFLLLLQSFATLSTRATLVSARYAWLKLQQSLVYDVSRQWSLQAGVFETALGFNAGRELGPMLAVWYRF